MPAAGLALIKQGNRLSPPVAQWMWDALDGSMKTLQAASLWLPVSVHTACREVLQAASEELHWLGATSLRRRVVARPLRMVNAHGRSTPHDGAVSFPVACLQACVQHVVSAF
jgi:hypothetical protein